MSDDVRAAVAAEPVLVECPPGSREVKVRPCFRVDENTYAVIESVGWEHAGDIWESAGMRDGHIRKVWRGITSGGTKCVGDTRTQLIRNLLDAREEFEVTIDDTIPKLF